MTLKLTPNVHAQWHPLKTIVVGKSFDPEYYEPIRNSQIRDGLQTIAEQTEQDFQNLIKTLEQFSIKVIRVDPGYRNIEIDISNNVDFGSIPTSPMMPRNSAIVFGDKLLITEKGNTAFDSLWYKTVNLENIINPWSQHTNPDLGSWQLSNDQQFHAPYLTRVGNRIFADTNEIAWLPTYLQQNLKNYNIVSVDIGGHNDGCYSPIVPGKLISITGETHYSQTFPGWEVYFVKQSWQNNLDQWQQIKNKTQGRWFIDSDSGIDVNESLINFVNSWLTQWVGYVEETVFDVNCLVLDQHHICFSNYNKDLWTWCKKIGINPILTPFRHRFFWDGGLHCMTLDLVRDGDQFDFETCA